MHKKPHNFDILPSKCVWHTVYIFDRQNLHYLAKLTLLTVFYGIFTIFRRNLHRIAKWVKVWSQEQKKTIVILKYSATTCLSNSHVRQQESVKSFYKKNDLYFGHCLLDRGSALILFVCISKILHPYILSSKFTFVAELPWLLCWRMVEMTYVRKFDRRHKWRRGGNHVCFTPHKLKRSHFQCVIVFNNTCKN